MHELAELRSLELHREVARAIRQNPALVQAARQRLRARLPAEPPTDSYASRWLLWLDLPIDELVARMTSDDEQGREMRQSTPFTFVIPHRQRWAIWARVRREQAGGPR